jgi:CheY-like chemotaxis protein
VFADAVRLQQVFWNILRNAVKFTPRRGKIVVETSTPKNSGTWNVKITDTGMGMTPEELERIFHAFTQGDHAAGSVHRFGGLGLGLAISQKIMELHSSHITATSKGRGQGSTFTIELALVEKKNASSPENNVAGDAPGEKLNGAGARVLLVEDHEPTRTALTILLLRRDYKVLAAGSIAEAREIAARGKIDLVISDIGLPDGNGGDLMRELRDKRGLKGIALTGYGMEEDIERNQKNGFVMHLTKPVRVQSLETALAAVT